MWLALSPFMHFNFSTESVLHLLHSNRVKFLSEAGIEFFFQFVFKLSFDSVSNFVLD
jgi:hypothetical protein